MASTARNVSINRAELSSCPDTVYLGDGNVASRLTFQHRGNALGNRVVSKDDVDEDTVLRGIFMVDSNQFRFTADANILYTSRDNIWKTKASCLLTAVPTSSHYSDYSFANKDYPTMCNNLKAIMDLVSTTKEKNVTSLLYDIELVSKTTMLKLTHTFFKPREADDSDDEFDSAAWTNFLTETNRPNYERWAHYTPHRVDTLPVYELINENWTKLPPNRYEELQGAIVDVSFTIAQWMFPVPNSNKVQIVYNAIPTVIRILQRKIQTSNSSRKRARKTLTSTQKQQPTNVASASSNKAKRPAPEDHVKDSDHSRKAQHTDTVTSPSRGKRADAGDNA